MYVVYNYLYGNVVGVYSTAEEARTASQRFVSSMPISVPKTDNLYFAIKMRTYGYILGVYTAYEDAKDMCDKQREEGYYMFIHHVCTSNYRRANEP